MCLHDAKFGSVVLNYQTNYNQRTDHFKLNRLSTQSQLCSLHEDGLFTKMIRHVLVQSLLRQKSM